MDRPSVESRDRPVVVEVYTIPEAAKALGRTELTFKRWIAEDLIPEPILIDSVRGYRHYSVGELRVVAGILARHEREFSYYTRKHSHTRNTIMQRLQAYRARSV